MKKLNMQKYGLEFLSVFIAVISAFALNSWKENRQDHIAADKILSEIALGLTKDLSDIQHNMEGHVGGINACSYWRKFLNKEPFASDSAGWLFIRLTRDFVFINNTSGYETLKSRGLELIANDSLRTHIISMYEYDYKTISKLEENYNELEFQENYFHPINNIIAPYFEYDSTGYVANIKTDHSITTADRELLLSYLWKIQANRNFLLTYYGQVADKIADLQQEIKAEQDR